MERCDCSPMGDCLMMRGELPVNQRCVELRDFKKCKHYNARDEENPSLFFRSCYPFQCEGFCKIR